MIIHEIHTAAHILLSLGSGNYLVLTAGETRTDCAVVNYNTVI